MRTNLCLTLAIFCLGHQLAQAQPDHVRQDLFLRTDDRWARSDWYGVDRNDDGVIGADEWVRVDCSGTGSVPPAWGKRVLRPAEHQRRTTREWEGQSESKIPK